MNALTKFLATVAAETAIPAEPEPDYWVTIVSYDEGADNFVIRVESNWGGAGGGPEELKTIPADILPLIIREYGVPSELIGRVFGITPV